MADKPLALCRGILYCYLAFELDEDDKDAPLGASFACESFTIPVPVYPLDQTPGAKRRRWVAVFPHAKDSEQAIAVVNRRTHERLASFAFTYSDMKWQSRMGYQIKKALTSRMRDIEVDFWSTGVTVELLDVFAASASEDILHVDIVFPYASCEDAVDPASLIRRGHVTHALVLEDGVRDDGKRHVTVSFRIAHESPDTLVLSQTSCVESCQPGMLAMSAAMRRAAFDNARMRMMSAGDDPMYAQWLMRHRAQPFQLQAQREAGQARSVGALVIVEKLDIAALEQCLAALWAQSVPVEQVCFLGHGAWKAKSFAKEHPVTCTQVGFAHDMKHFLESQPPEHVLVLDQHDVLEPDAVFHLASGMHDAPQAQLVYCDDDVMDRELVSCHAPRLKPGLDRDMLYAHNYVGSCVLVRRAVLDSLALLDVGSANQMVYATALRLSVDRDAIAHVARVLVHHRDQRRASRIPASDPQLLAAHLHSLDVSAHITREGDCNRVVYDVIEPEPLVSIVIPTKDHPHMLEACVDSVLRKAGYDNLEVVLVENNSADPATFELYDKLVAQDARVRVVTFEGEFNFSKIVNYGVSQAKGAYVLILNNDTEVITEGFLRIMAGYLSRPDVGVVGALLRYPDGLVQSAGMALMADGRLGFPNQNLMPGYAGGYMDTLAHPCEYSALLGACQLVRREDFDSAGGYTEELAVTYNDVDFCWKMRDRGLACVFTPYVELYHREFASRGRDRVSDERAMQTEVEAGLMRMRWPRYFACGDPVYNPACNQSTPYFQLRW